MKRTPPSLASDLNAKAVIALHEARGMAPGDKRTEAMQKAKVLRNAVEIQEFFSDKRGAPAK